MARALNAVVHSHTLNASEFGLPQQGCLVEALEGLGVPVCVEDARDRKFLYSNRAFRALFSAGESGSSFAAFEAGFVTPPSEQLARQGRARPADGIAEGEFRHAASKRWYRVLMRSTAWNGERRARQYTLVDATERVAARQRNDADQERLLMTSRIMSVGELVTTLAHELNQPLGAIANYLGGAVRRLQGVPDSAPSDVVSVLEKARLQADHAARIVARMREFVRTREPRREPVDMAGVVDGVLKLLELPAQQCGVRIGVDMPASLPRAMVDPVMIEQVVLNLTKNALEAMAEVPVQRRSLRISGRVDADGCVELAVADTGPGMSDDAQEQLYSPFFTTKPDGMGMGLNICRSIVEYHQGRLFFANNPERGTTFRVALPAAGTEVH